MTEKEISAINLLIFTAIRSKKEKVVPRFAQNATSEAIEIAQHLLDRQDHIDKET